MLEAIFELQNQAESRGYGQSIHDLIRLGDVAILPGQLHVNLEFNFHHMRKMMN